MRLTAVIAAVTVLLWAIGAAAQNNPPISGPITFAPNFQIKTGGVVDLASKLTFGTLATLDPNASDGAGGGLTGNATILLTPTLSATHSVGVFVQPQISGLTDKTLYPALLNASWGTATTPLPAGTTEGMLATYEGLINSAQTTADQNGDSGHIIGGTIFSSGGASFDAIDIIHTINTVDAQTFGIDHAIVNNVGGTLHKFVFTAQMTGSHLAAPGTVGFRVLGPGFSSSTGLERDFASEERSIRGENDTFGGYALFGDNTLANPAALIGNTGSGVVKLGGTSTHDTHIISGNLDALIISGSTQAVAVVNVLVPQTDNIQQSGAAGQQWAEVATYSVGTASASDLRIVSHNITAITVSGSTQQITVSGVLTPAGDGLLQLGAVTQHFSDIFGLNLHAKNGFYVGAGDTPGISATIVAGGCSITTVGGIVTAQSGCGSGSLTVTDGTNSVAGTSTLTVGAGFVVGGSTPSATLNFTTTLNVQSGTGAYAIAPTDAAKLIIRTNGSGGADTLANATGALGNGYGTNYQTGAFAGNTITVSTALLNGLTAITLGSYQGLSISSSGGNYYAMIGLPQPPTQTGTTCVRDNMIWQNCQSEMSISYQPGMLTSVTTTKSAVSKFAKASSVDNIVGSAATFTCTGNPTVTLYECGTDATCAAPTTIGSVTVTSAGTAVSGSVSSPAVTAGDYVAWAISGGTCTALDVAATAQAHQI